MQHPYEVLSKEYASNLAACSVHPAVSHAVDAVCDKAL
jgi:hypothetical protein